MGRPNQSEARRAELLPIVAAVFAELGYRRTTTAALAARCAVQETILYRLWPDKRAMFLAAIEHVVQHAETIWARRAAARPATMTAAEAVLEHEAVHLGEFGLYRILFAGLSETDDADVAEALRSAYRRFHAFLLARLREHRDEQPNAALPPAELSAWALIGLGTVVNIGRELELLPKGRRTDLLRQVGRQLLGSDLDR
ncbi:MAG: TetR/AcrR family transcriptional regulator [Planctomycetes bacterium]|nr:TetR/AcrR family transcriptional regulator [Planctomycetota bacterium]